MLPQLYHAHHNRYLEDLPFWLSLVEQTGDPVLELGCGTGRVLKPLAEAGHRTIGLDYNFSMLEFFKSNIGSIIIKPQLIAADISRFNLATSFQLIFLPCNTFSTLDDSHRIGCLASIHHHLAHGGIFAVSLPNPAILKVLPARSASQLEDEFYHPQTGNPVQVSSSWTRTKRNFTLTWTYDQLFPDGTVEHLDVKTDHYLTTFENYVSEIENAGLALVEAYGDFNRSAYHPDSPHLILIATQPHY
jgi:SAM-dependent methyltransferase